MGYSMPVRGKFSILRLGAAAGVPLLLKRRLFEAGLRCGAFCCCILKGTELVRWLAP